jgi:D-cysteine desulfhydrase
MIHKDNLTRLQAVPRFPLAHTPTPLHPLHRLSQYLNGPNIWIKRDDQTGLASGGNKARKLEFLIAAALAEGADTVITAGAVQSNHCRQTAAAANLAGLQCDLVLSGKEPADPNGNLLLDLFLGANLHYTTRELRSATMKQVAEQLQADGKQPFIIPIGGSTGLGALGYALAMAELAEQVAEIQMSFDRILVASSSGGTQAGMALGARLFDFMGEILGISIDNEKLEGRPFQQELCNIAGEAADLLNMDIVFSNDDFSVQYDYLGEGYGVVGPLEKEAIRIAARQEGVILDPVYSGRAFGAMMDLIRKQKLDRKENILFWHTGGSAALFAYNRELL